MPNYTTPGQTFRLEPPWTAAASGAGNSWNVFLREGSFASTGVPNGWTVTVVSGSFGASDLVVDITSPASGTNNMLGTGAYDVQGRFVYRTGAGVTFEKRFPFSFTQLFFNGDAEVDVLFDETTGRHLAATPEPDGLQIYRFSDHMNEREALGLLPLASYPSLWREGRRVCLCALNGSPLDTTGATSKLLRNITYQYPISGSYAFFHSDDDGATWVTDNSKAVPFDSAYYQTHISSLGHGGTLYAVAFRLSDGLKFYRCSTDGGATWGTATALPGNPTVHYYKFHRFPDSFLIHGGYEQGVGVNYISADNGRSFIFVPYNTGNNTPWFSGNAIKHRYATQRAQIAASGYRGTPSKLFFTWSALKKPLSWMAPAEVATNPDRSAFEIFQQQGIFWLTNGRDRLYRSRTWGRTWEARH